MTGGSSAPNRNTVWARTLVEELVRAGVREVVLAPGSRSTPLVMAVAARADLRVITHLDERSAAFLALGMGKASGRPAVVLTTSGTAAANLFPAVVEASLSETPLLVLTADRPGRLRAADANQTIDQLHLYGPHVRAFFELPEPVVEGSALRHLRTIAVRAVAAALGLPGGPVHLNVPFDKPLEPVDAPGDVPPGFAERHPRAWRGRADDAPYVRVGALRPVASIAEIDALAKALAGAERPLLVAGPVAEPERVGEAAVALAAAAGVPLLADPLSGARFGPAAGATVVGTYDLVLAPEIRRRLPEPDLIVRVGRTPTSATLTAFLEECGGARQIVIDAGEHWKDHLAVATDYVRAEAAGTLRAVAERLAAGTTRDAWVAEGEPPAASRAASDVSPGSPATLPSRAWLRLWQRLEETARRTLSPQSSSSAPAPSFYEGRVLARIAADLPAHATLFVSSSMPVRDLDAFATPREAPLLAFGNRGASGIDGIVSTALGVGALRPGPVVAVLGDLAFYHDMNGLLATREAGLAVVFVVIHNDGGGIFHMLPIREHEPEFTRHFVTPHGLDFRHAAALYGLPFERVADEEGLAGALARALAAGGSRIVEVTSDREENRQRRGAGVAAVRRSAEAVLDEEPGGG